MKLFNITKDDPEGLLDVIDSGELKVNEPSPSNNTNTTSEIVEYLFEPGFEPCNEHLNSISQKNSHYIMTL